jgi:hypothetical protein
MCRRGLLLVRLVGVGSGEWDESRRNRRVEGFASVVCGAALPAAPLPPRAPEVYGTLAGRPQNDRAPGLCLPGALVFWLTQMGESSSRPPRLPPGAEWAADSEPARPAVGRKWADLHPAG